jgi:micrococcal nuclease
MGIHFGSDDGTEEGELKFDLIGVDAPESRNAFKKKLVIMVKNQKLYLTNLLKSKRVKLEYDVVNYRPIWKNT